MSKVIEEIFLSRFVTIKSLQLNVFFTVILFLSPCVFAIKNDEKIQKQGRDYIESLQVKSRDLQNPIEASCHVLGLFLKSLTWEDLINFVNLLVTVNTSLEKFHDVEQLSYAYIVTLSYVYISTLDGLISKDPELYKLSKNLHQSFEEYRVAVVRYQIMNNKLVKAIANKDLQKILDVLTQSETKEMIKNLNEVSRLLADNFNLFLELVFTRYSAS